MASAAQYRRYAEECMDMAERASPLSRKQLIQMAEAWLKLAQEQLALEHVSGADHATAPPTNKVQ